MHVQNIELHGKHTALGELSLEMIPSFIASDRIEHIYVYEAKNVTVN